jgi:hypothetical protein
MPRLAALERVFLGLRAPPPPLAALSGGTQLYSPVFASRVKLPKLPNQDFI